MKARVRVTERLSANEQKRLSDLVNREVNTRLERGLKVATQNALIQLVCALHTDFGFGAGRIDRLFAVMARQKEELDELSDENVMIESLLRRLELDGINLRPMMIDVAENEETLYTRDVEKERAIRVRREQKADSNKVGKGG